MPAGNPRAWRAGFSLLEMLAVVVMFGLLATFVMPNIGAVRARSLRRHAEDVASLLEFARQRAITTGIPHRVHFDLEASSYRVEWLGPEKEEPENGQDAGAAGAVPGSPGSAVAPVGAGLLDLSPPRQEAHDYEPLPGPFGRDTFLEEEVAFAGIETTGGWADRGEVTVTFETDGSTDYAEIVLDDESGAVVRLEVLPLADVVRLRDEG